MKRARIIWTIVFLGITLAAIVMEIVAGIFHPAGTIPWTEYLAQYVPWPVQLVAYVVLAVWLPFHFWRHDHLRKTAYKQGFQSAYQEGHAEGFKQGRATAAYKTGGVIRSPSPLGGLLRTTGVIGPEQDARVDAPDDPGRGDVHY